MIIFRNHDPVKNNGIGLVSFLTYFPAKHHDTQQPPQEAATSINDSLHKIHRIVPIREISMWNTDERLSGLVICGKLEFRDLGRVKDHLEPTFYL